MKNMLARLALLGGTLLVSPPGVGEILLQLSDETESAAPQPDTPANNDRRIIYRVICTPGDEALPDCERPFSDTETVAQPTVQQKADLPADDTDMMDEAIPQPKAAKAKTKSGKNKATNKTSKSKKSSSKKKAAKKSTAKKSASKKTTAKKK